MTLTFARIAIGILFVALNCSSVLAQLQVLTGEGDFKFASRHRVNAHGDEFNTLARSSDGQRLFTGTEKGDVIVWNVTTNQLERTLHQSSGIHFVAALPDSREVIAAGSNHFKPANALVRRWNVETGTFVDLTGIDTDSFITALATDTEAGLIAVTSENGTVVVWDSQTNKELARWKLNGFPTAPHDRHRRDVRRRSSVIDVSVPTRQSSTPRCCSDTSAETVPAARPAPCDR